MRDGKRDEIKLLQPKFVPEFKVGMTTQHTFIRIEKISEHNEVETIEWCAGAINKISSSTTFLTTTFKGPKCHKKDGDVEAKQNVYADDGEDSA